MAINRETRKTEILINGSKAEASIKEMAAAAAVLRSELNKLPDGPERMAKSRDFEKINGRLKKTKEEVFGVKKGVDEMGGIMKKWGPAVLGFFAVDRIQAFLTNVIDVTKEFQRMEAVLTNTLGSESAAKRAMKEIEELGANTPQSVGQLIDGFVKLANQGFKPTREEMVKLLDLTNSMGKEYDQLVEAIIDAQTGEFERLKEFGIRASKQGDKVTFTFKEQQTQVDFTASSIREYLLSLGDMQGVAGSTAAISETLGGMISNLGDSFDQLYKSIGELLMPVMSEMIGMLGRGISSIVDLIKPTENAAEATRELYQAMDFELEILKNANLGQEARAQQIENINTKYGKYLPRLITEKDTLEDIAEIQQNINNQMLRKVLLIQYQEELGEILKKQAQLLKSQAMLQQTQALFDEMAEQGDRQAPEFGQISDEDFAAQQKEIQAEIEALKQRFETQANLLGTTMDEIAREQNEDAQNNAEERTRIEITEMKNRHMSMEMMEKKRKSREAQLIKESNKAFKEGVKERSEAYIAQQKAETQAWANQWEARAMITRDAGNIVMNVLSIMGKAGQETIALQKGLALAQIALDTAQAISALTRYAEQNPANAITFGAAGVAVWVSGIARIMGNIGQAISLINSSDVSNISGGGGNVSFNRGGGFIGNSTGQVAGPDGTIAGNPGFGDTGGGGFASGGYTGRGAGAPDASGSRVAGKVHEDEYVISSPVLNTPAGLNAALMSERVRLGMMGSDGGELGQLQASIDLLNRNLEGGIIAMLDTDYFNDRQAQADDIKKRNGMEDFVIRRSDIAPDAWNKIKSRGFGPRTKWDN
jgi:hypothetical protein